MPKLKVSENEKKVREIKSILTSGMILQGYDKKDIARLMDVDVRTVRNWLNDPYTISYRNLSILANKLRLTEEQKGKLI